MVDWCGINDGFGYLRQEMSLFCQLPQVVITRGLNEVFVCLSCDVDCV